MKITFEAKNIHVLIRSIDFFLFRIKHDPKSKFFVGKRKKKAKDGRE